MASTDMHSIKNLVLQFIGKDCYCNHAFNWELDAVHQQAILDDQLAADFLVLLTSHHRLH